MEYMNTENRGDGFLHTDNMMILVLNYMGSVELIVIQ